jgi:hypothetical protein
MSGSLRKIASINQVNDSRFSGLFDSSKAKTGVFDEKKIRRYDTAKESPTLRPDKHSGLGMDMLRQIGFAKQEELPESDSEDSRSEVPSNRQPAYSQISDLESFGDYSSQNSDDSKKADTITTSH